MSGFGATPIDGSPTPIPMSSAVSPGDATPRALEGGGELTDSNGNILVPAVFEDIERPGYIALTTPPAQTTAGADTPLTFSKQVNRVIMQNNTSSAVYFAFDQAASPGSLVLLPGAFLSYPKKCTVLHLYTVAVQNINGTVAGGIVVLGAL